MRPTRIDAARGAMLGTLTGDALGMPFEGKPPNEIPQRLEMIDGRLPRGSYTDDTQMAIALAESLIACGGVDDELLARAFLDAFDPRRGYGEGTTAVMRLLAEGTPAADAARLAFGGGGSLGNGAAMRVAAVAIRYADDQGALLDAARRSARITHAHGLAIDAAAAQASGVGAALRGEDPLTCALSAAETTEMRNALNVVADLLAEDPPPPPAAVAAAVGNGFTGHTSVPAALYAAVAHETFEQAVSFAVRCGGDTDTIGAMAGAIAGARAGARAIPARWLDALEDRGKGRSHVERLAAQLASPVLSRDPKRQPRRE